MAGGSDVSPLVTLMPAILRKSGLQEHGAPLAQNAQSYSSAPDLRHASGLLPATFATFWPACT